MMALGGRGLKLHAVICVWAELRRWYTPLIPFSRATSLGNLPLEPRCTVETCHMSMVLSMLPQMVACLFRVPHWCLPRYFTKLGFFLGTYACTSWGMCRAGRVRVSVFLLLVSILHVCCINMTISMLLSTTALTNCCTLIVILPYLSSIGVHMATRPISCIMIYPWLGWYF